MIAALTGAGLASAAGLNAFIPYVIVALLARFTPLLTLPEQFEWIQSWPSIIVASILLISETFFDKIAVVDSVNDAVATFIRPTVGGLISLATAAAADVDQSSYVQEHPWIPVVLGVVSAAVVHGLKVGSRPVVNAASLGLGAPVVSTVEDGVSVGVSFVAILAPLLILLLIPLVIAAIWFFIKQRQKMSKPGI